MAGWSSFANGSSLDCLETEGASHGNDCCLALDHLAEDHVVNADEDKVKQECLFNQLFQIYLKENCPRGINIRPVPVLLGDGQSLDLYKVFSLVKERGGYAVVSKRGLWGSVLQELGLNLQVLPSVKLVYDKYLDEFERWLRKLGKKFKYGNHGCEWGFKSLPIELEKEFRGLLCPNLKVKDDGFVQLESNKIGNHIDVDNHKSDANLLDSKNQNKIFVDVQNVPGDDDEIFRYGIKDDLTTLDVEVAENEINSRKRKREALSGMLNWIKDIAKNPLDHLTQPIPKPSKWKDKGGDFLVQIIRAREVLLLRHCVEPKSGLSSLQKLKMHPAMYEDHTALSHQSAVKLRCSERVPSSVKSRLCSCCNAYSTDGNKSPSSAKTEAEKCHLDKTTATVDLLAAKIMADHSGDDPIEKIVSVGPLFQAEVPEWTGIVSESDSKWLGTQVWPPKCEDFKPDTETEIIGRGREEKCGCQFPGSVECVRFHIAEKRMELKLELGSTFYRWGFDRMGEEVSLQWTTEEEKRFKDMIRSNIPSQNGIFRSNSFKYFPDKTRKKLVSYYFNAFLIQLRSYQNRVTPMSVDSDDDEVEFGTFSDGFGMESIKGPCDNFLECSLNKQCTDLE